MNHSMKYFYNEEVYKDLSIGNEIFKRINNTVTAIGRKKLRNRLRYCSVDLEHLENLALKNYTIHKDLLYRYDMENYLQRIKQLEIKIDDWMIKDCDNCLIYKWNIFNNRYLLSISNKLKFSQILITYVIYILIYLYYYYNGQYSSPKQYVNDLIVSYNSFCESLCMTIMSNKIWIERTTLILATIYISHQLYQIYQSINANYEHYSKCGAFCDDYQKIREYINTVNDMCNIEIYQDIDKIKESIKYLEYYFPEDSSLGYSLVTKLGNENYVKHINVLANFVGRVDCNICVAKLIDEGYSIPKFVQSQFPILHIDGAWSPIIPFNQRVKNSITLNVTTPNVQIITGPNKAGKSTFMRSVMTVIYLAQSLGISSADKLSLTPFRDMFTHLNLPDHIGRESLFEAEYNRCYEYIEQIESLRGFSIGIIDELFTSTNPLEGKAASYAVLKRLADNPINITLLSTHFHDIISALRTNKFKFNKFSAIKKGNKLHYTYKIEDGVSNQCTALQLLQEKGFEQSLIDDALNYIVYEDNKNKNKNNNEHESS